MKKILLPGIIFAALIAPVSAADIPVRGPVYTKAPPPAPVFNWTGFYVGAHIGYGWGETDWSTVIEPSGVFGGLQLGYNWQFNPNWVVGVETDISATDINDAFPQHFDYVGTLRGRIGYTWDRTMLYATGGLAYAEAGIGGFHHTHIGWTIGAGLEWAFAPNWSAKAEYLYIDLEDKVYPAVWVGYDIHTVRLGVNYRFGY